MVVKLVIFILPRNCSYIRIPRSIITTVGSKPSPTHDKLTMLQLPPRRPKSLVLRLVEVPYVQMLW